jgi:hypothetical protein
VRFLVGVLLLVALVMAGCGGSGTGSSALTAASPLVAKQLLIRQLEAKKLDYTWIACIRNGRSFRSVPITRCNVGFGIDPHVEAYCIVLKGGELVSNFSDPAIPCGHDNAGVAGNTIVTVGG